PTRALARTPGVIAMWQPMAEALGWDKRPIGWEDLLKLAQSKDGWASRGHPEWGAFRFGHPHPDYTFPGLAAVTAMTAAAVGKTRGLTEDDFEDPRSIAFLTAIERNCIFPSQLLGDLGQTFLTKGPARLQAVALRESLVVNANQEPNKARLAYPVVAIYP